jgi:hypothetical protein
MKSILITLSFLLITLAAQADVLKAVKSPKSVNPNQMTFFQSKYFANDYYVSVVAVETDSSLLEQKVVLNMGAPDFAYKQSFIIPIVGSVINTVMFLDGDSIVVRIRTQGTPMIGGAGTSFGGYGEYTVTVKEDFNTDTGYSSKANLEKAFFREASE